MADSKVTFKVKTEVLHQKSASINKKTSMVKKAFDEMERIVRNTNIYWEGEAGDVHRTAYQGFQEEILEIIARLEEHVTDLESMAGVYEKTEQQVQAVIEELPKDVIV